MRQRVTVVVPTFRPDPADLIPLIERVRAEGDEIVVSDDASPCTSDPTLEAVRRAGATVVRHRRNAGIARGLNDGLASAVASGSTWLLTVDQDSLPGHGHVDALLREEARASTVLGPGRIGAIAAGRIADASGPLAYPTRDITGCLTTEEVIQTGTLWRVSTLMSVGGFDESLGIDAVDAAACLALRSHGSLCLVVPDVSIGHRLGSARQVRVLGRTVVVSGHSAERRATIVRNRLRLFPAEFAASPKHALRTIRRVVVSSALAVTVEDDRRAKARATARGLLGGSVRSSPGIPTVAPVNAEPGERRGGDQDG